MTDSHAAPAHTDHGHSVPLWGLFLALLALTAAEVGLYEAWHHDYLAVPKFVLVMLILLFTFPKAGIVLIYFMHLKFEKLLVVVLAIAPFILIFVAVLIPLIDAKVLQARATNQMTTMGHYKHEGAPGTPGTPGTPGSPGSPAGEKPASAPAETY